MRATARADRDEFAELRAQIAALRAAFASYRQQTERQRDRRRQKREADYGPMVAAIAAHLHTGTIFNSAEAFKHDALRVALESLGVRDTETLGNRMRVVNGRNLSGLRVVRQPKRDEYGAQWVIEDAGG